MLTILIYLAIIAIVCWVVTKIPLPAPFAWIAYVVIAIFAIWMLLSLTGAGGPGLSLR